MEDQERFARLFESETLGQILAFVQTHDGDEDAGDEDQTGFKITLMVRMPKVDGFLSISYLGHSSFDSARTMLESATVEWCEGRLGPTVERFGQD